MASTQVKLRLPGENVFRAAIVAALARKLDLALRKASSGIAHRLGEAAEAALRASPAWNSLVGGQLYHELGVVDAEPILEHVARNVRNGVLVQSLGVRPQGERLTGGLRMQLLKGDYSEVLDVDGAEFVSEGRYVIPWLRWLTLGGNAILVGDYHFESGHTQASRTSDGIMVRSGTWQVPAEYSGTEEDNWLTRALLSALPAATVNILSEEIARSL
jgi:hypothetical protein